MEKLTLDEWAKKYDVSTKYDYEKFENREFLKRLDDALFIDKNKKKKESLKDEPEMKKGLFEKFKYLLSYEKENKSKTI